MTPRPSCPPEDILYVTDLSVFRLHGGAHDLGRGLEVRVPRVHQCDAQVVESELRTETGGTNTRPLGSQVPASTTREPQVCGDGEEGESDVGRAVAR